MYTYIVAIELPPFIKQQLSTFLCYGLPLVNWIEEDNFCIFLRSLGRVNDSLLFEIKDRLSAVNFASFQATLQGVEYSRSKGGRGVLWTHVKPTESVVKLKNGINEALKGLPLSQPERSSQPHVVLGKVNVLSDFKLSDYLSQHSLYQSASFEISSFSLFQAQDIARNILIEQYQSQ